MIFVVRHCGGMPSGAKGGTNEWEGEEGSDFLQPPTATRNGLPTYEMCMCVHLVTVHKVHQPQNSVCVYDVGAAHFGLHVEEIALVVIRDRRRLTSRAQGRQRRCEPLRLE